MKILVLSRWLEKEHVQRIEEAAAVIGAEVRFYASEADVPAEERDADVVYGYGRNIARTSKALQWLCLPSAGVDAYLAPGSFANENCLLSNSGGAYGVSIAEHIIAVSLMMMRRITDFYASSLAGEWLSPMPQKSLKDCRITVLGTGDIGRSFAVRVKVFEPARLTGACRSGYSACPAFDSVVSADALDDVLPETDLLVMCLPATNETDNILSAARIKLLPKGAYVVNVGRGSAIDEEALADSLEDGHLAGAALDVFRVEPLPADSRLWKTKNLLITPHVAGNLTLPYTLEKNVDMFLEDLGNFAAGQPLKHLVDRARGY